MSMNGIDIASYQAGIDVSVVPSDFVIVKATEGTNYINPHCNAQAGQTLSQGKKLGLYHFASGGDAVAEADYFVDNIRGYLGQAILVLDWEGDALNRGPGWAKTWLDKVQERTGIKPLIYMSNSVVNSYDWNSIAAADYGLWNAGYYAGYETMGYNPDAPLVGGTGAWQGAALYQYTSSGRLPGWDGNLDLNVFYGDGKTWDKYAGSNTNRPEEKAERKNVHLYEFNGGFNQQWKTEMEKDGYMKLTCRGNGLCLDAEGAGKSNGTNVQVYPSNDTAAQRWKEKIIEKGDEDKGTCCVEIIPKHAPDMRVDCKDGKLGNKTNIQLYKANGSDAQRWFKRRLSDGYIVYINVNSGRVMDGGGSIK